MATIARQPCDEGVIQSAPASAPCTSDAGPWVLVATILGSSMAFIDTTVVHVALPALQVDLNATVVDAQWIVEAYALFLAALILVGGSFGDHFGRRRMYGLGVLIFAVASAWCGLAPNAGQLIIARGVQGIGGALLVPGSLAIISASFDGERRGKAIGTWSGFTGITSAAGPVLGGWLVENVSWRWVFFLNIPLAVIVLAILFAHVPESRDEDAKGLDLPGGLLAVIGLGGIVYGLIESGNLGLGHPIVLGALAVGLVGIVGFVLREARAQAPMMPLDLFRSRTFSGANLLTMLLYWAIGGAMFFFPFNLQQVQGYSATAAGAAMLPMIVLMSLLSRWSGGLVGRYGAKRPLIIGPVIAALGFVLFAVPGVGGSYWTTFLPAVIVLGLGMAVSVAPLTTTVMGAVEQRHAGLASGVNNAVSRTAGLLAIAVMSIVLLTAFNRGLDSRLSALEVSPEVRAALDRERTKLGGAEVPAEVTGEGRVALERAIDDSFVASFRLVMLISAGLALASGLSAAALIEGKMPDNATRGRGPKRQDPERQDTSRGDRRGAPATEGA